MNTKKRINILMASVLVLSVFAIVPTIAAETNPPVVTDPSASPSTIANDGTQYAELIVHVVDDTAIDKVTVDLSPIGGNIVHMSAKSKNVFNYTANATCPPGAYNLQVYATDIYGNNNTGEIALDVTAAPAAPVVNVEDCTMKTVGLTKTVNITLSTAPNGLSGYNMTVSLSEPGIAEIISVNFPAWAIMKSNSTLPADSFWMKAVDLMKNVEANATNIPLGSLTVRGDVQGKCNITVTVTRMEDDNGNPISPVVNPGVLTIAPVTISFSPPESKISIDATTTVDIILDTAPNGLSGYNMTVSLSNPGVAEIISVDFPAWATLKSNSTLPADSFWMNAVDLGDRVTAGARNVNIGTLTIRGDSEGISNITLTVTSLDNDPGYAMPVNIRIGQIEVILVIVITIPGEANPPTDPDGDGIYDDMNGNGRMDFDDVVVFFKNMEWIAANQPIPYFDFNGNDRIDFNDIVILFKKR